MGTQVLRPNGDGTGVGSFQTLGGLTTNLYTTLADDNDTTGIIKKTTVTGTQRMNFTMGTTALSASQKVRYVRVRAKATAPLSSSKFDLQLGITSSGLSSYSQPLSIRGQNTTTKTFTGGYFAYAPDGQPWTQNRIDSLFVQITEYGENTGTVSAVSLRELYVDVVIANKPVLYDNTTPTPVANRINNPSTTASSYPTATWTYVDSDGDAQEYYRMKIFTPAQYGVGSFNPETSVAFYDSGEVASYDQFATATDLIPNGTYKIYVKAGKKIAGSIFYSDWTTAGTTFVPAVTAPSVPSLSATYSSSTNSVALTATGTNYTSGSQTFQIQRSDDGGTTWNDVRNASALVPSGSYVASITDYEAYRTTVYYRVRSVGLNTSTGNNTVSAWSSTVSKVITNDKTWWFKPVAYPAFNVGGVKVNYGITETIVETAGVYRPLNRNDAIIVSGAIYQNDGTYQISIVSDAEWDAMENILKSQCPILVQDPYGTQKYVRFINRTADLAGNSGRRVRSLKIDYVEVTA